MPIKMKELPETERPYEKLEQYFIENNGMYNDYRLFSMNLNDDYYYPMMKLIDTKTYMRELDTTEIKDMGVYLDIFPLDGSPNNSFFRKIYLKSKGESIGV